MNTEKLVKQVNKIPEIESSLETNAYQMDNKAKNYVLGMEYLTFYHNLLIKEQYGKIVFSGDSTTYGTNIKDNRYKIDRLCENYLRSNGVLCECVNKGHESMNAEVWLNQYIAEDMALNPSLYIVRWGVNDGAQPISDRFQKFIYNLREGLRQIRANYPVDTLSIIVMMPNSTNDDYNGRNAEWYDQIYNSVLDISREFQCCFVDTYHYLLDSTNVTWQDEYIYGGKPSHIHPLEVGNVWISNLLSQCLLPNTLKLREEVSILPSSNFLVSSGHIFKSIKNGGSVHVFGVLSGGTNTQFETIGNIPYTHKPIVDYYTFVQAVDGTGKYESKLVKISANNGAIVCISHINSSQIIVDLNYVF